MAEINREYCYYENALGMCFEIPISETWEGMGWAIVHVENWLAIDKQITLPFVSIGSLVLRFIGWGRLDGLYVVEADNWRWPIWWALLRPWRVLWHLWQYVLWFERNLRLTAKIWGLIKCNITEEPHWRDFILLWWIRQWRRPKVFKIEMLYDLLGKTWPPQ